MENKGWNMDDLILKAAIWQDETLGRSVDIVDWHGFTSKRGPDTFGNESCLAHFGPQS
jgi:hypothetical protein